MDEKLKQRVIEWLKISGTTKSAFCRKVGICTQHLNDCMNGKCNMSIFAERRIEAYLNQFKINKE